MERVYIAGPMQGHFEFNFPAFFAAEKRLQATGFDVFNPARNDEEHGVDVTGLSGDLSELPNFNLKEVIRDDLGHLMECTHMLMLSGWENSTGAKAERAVGVWLGLEIMHEEDQSPE